MNVLQICSGTLVNGAIIHALLLSRELARRGHRLTMVCRPGAWIGEQLADDPVEVVFSDLRRFPPGELRRVAAFIRQQQIDVIQTHLSRAHFFGVLLRWLTGVPCVATAQSRHFQLHWMFNDFVVAASDATRRYHCQRNFVSPRRVATLHNFVDHRRFAADHSGRRQRIRTELGIPDGAPLIGCIGDLFPRKGQTVLVAAMPQILAAVPDAHLLLVGPEKDPKYTAKTRELAKRLGIARAIRWAGQRDDVADVLTALDLKVLPSLEETLPLAILEAMAAGLPVVATTVGGIPECVAHGETGLLVPPADSAALATAVIALLADPARRQQYGQAAREHVRERFSPDHHAQALETIFSHLISARKAA